MASSVHLLFKNEDNETDILLKYILLLFLTQPKFIRVWEYNKLTNSTHKIIHVPCVLVHYWAKKSLVIDFHFSSTHTFTFHM